MGYIGDFKIPAAKIVGIKSGMPMSSKAPKLAYYVPLKFNLKAIDALFISLNQKKKTVYVVAIQITVAEWHEDSEAAFFADLDAWLSGRRGFEIKSSFLWIHEGDRGRAMVEEKLTRLRNRTVQGWPLHGVR